jgi:hypothetical protein
MFVQVQNICTRTPKKKSSKDLVSCFMLSLRLSEYLALFERFVLYYYVLFFYFYNNLIFENSMYFCIF